mmetsp:Transcript_16765/g.43954  ORF Transcript_16765/g.43954 Transcript_16765/m.43954 type:complete len:220 (-) Transcript_16765:44-703(-)
MLKLPPTSISSKTRAACKDEKAASVSLRQSRRFSLLSVAAHASTMMASAASSNWRQDPRSRQLSVSDVFDCACANIRNGARARQAASDKVSTRKPSKNFGGKTPSTNAPRAASVASNWGRASGFGLLLAWLVDCSTAAQRSLCTVCTSHLTKASFAGLSNAGCVSSARRKQRAGSSVTRFRQRSVRENMVSAQPCQPSWTCLPVQLRTILDGCERYFYK